MDPVSAMVIGVAGAGVSAFGNYMQGQTTAAMNQYKAGVAQMNAQIAQANANYASYAGEVQAQQQGMKTRYEVGQARAEQGASGLDVRSGSALRVQQGIEAVGQQNVGIIRSDAAKKAYGYQVEGLQDTAEAKLDTYAASTAKTAGDIAAIGSILGGAASVSSKYTAAQQAGVNTNWPYSASSPLVG